MNQRKFLLQCNYMEDNIIKITPPQCALLGWLYRMGYFKEDFTYTNISDDMIAFDADKIVYEKLKIKYEEDKQTKY